jgi:hypothetical protein
LVFDVIMFHGGVDEHRLTAAQAHHLGVGHPVGRRDDDFVAGVHGGEQRVVDHVLAAGADDGLARLVVEAVLPLELGGDRLPEGNDAGHGRVLGLAAPYGGDRRLLDVLRRVEIRLPDGKADHVPPLGFQIPRFLRDDDGRRRLDTGQGVRQKAHDISPIGALEHRTQK